MYYATSTKLIISQFGAPQQTDPNPILNPTIILMLFITLSQIERKHLAN